jgi:hypothetical protein
MESNGPYLSLVVVTKHDTNPGLFNTKFRLNFHSPQPRAGDNATFPYQDHAEDNIITIGTHYSGVVLCGCPSTVTHAAVIAAQAGPRAAT